ncbi:MAG: branched-chain amino acid ABC transporter permease [Sulfolobales archaeon]
MVLQVEPSTLLSLIIFPLIYAPLYVAISLGFNILFSSTRIINIAYGDLIMLGAYTAYWLYKLYSIPPIVSILIAAPIGGATGYILYKTLFKKILESKVHSIIEEQSIIATFGLSMAIQGIIAYIWSPTAVSYTYLDQGIALGGLSIPINLFLITGIGMIITIATYILLYRSYLGIALRGVIQAPQLAEDIGLNIDRVYMAATILSVVLPLIAGVAISMRVQIYPSMGLEYLALALVITALGGLGNPLGSLVGAIAYTAMDSLISYLLPPGLKLFYLYILFLLILLVRPTGILGRPHVVR